MYGIIPLFIFILGCFFGSFLNLLIDRIPKKENVILGRSHCEACGKNLGSLDLIPVISFMWLRGKCRYCHVPLSYFYPFMEILTGALFVFVYIFVSNDLRFTIYDLRFWLTLFYYLAISSSLIVIFFIDAKNGIIPDRVLLCLLVITALYQIFFAASNIPNHIISGLVSFIFFAFLALITRGRGMGFGDIKFAFVLGLILGFPAFILGLYSAFLTGAITSIILILWGKKKLKKDTIAFGPFMAIGIFLAMYFSSVLMPRLLPFLVP